MIHFSIVITGYNSVTWVDRCIKSALEQNYPNFDVYCVDAQTTDGTYDKLCEYRTNHWFHLIHNEYRRQYQVQNIYETVRDYVPHDSVVVSLDLDDWLPHDNVLKKLESVYRSGDVWMTYGTYEEYPYRDVSHHYHAYPSHVINDNTYRKHKWLGSHLRTWKRELFLSIPESALIDPRTNDYYDMAGDQAIMLPMLEMARERAVYIPDILYVYNKSNPLSEDRTSIQKQSEISQYIRNLSPFDRINELCSMK